MLQEQQMSTDRSIADAMVESVPESWTSIVLTLTRPSGETGIGQILHSITSPEGFPPVAPVDEVFATTYSLDKLFQEHGAVFTKAVYEVDLQAQSWSWKASFEYLPNGPGPTASSGEVDGAIRTGRR